MPQETGFSIALQPLSHPLIPSRRLANILYNLKINVFQPCMCIVSLKLKICQKGETLPIISCIGSKHYKTSDAKHKKLVGPEGYIKLPTLLNTIISTCLNLKVNGQKLRSSNIEL